MDRNAEKSTMDDKGVFNPGPVHNLPSGKKAIDLHWVFVWKDTDTDKVAKAWIVAQGHLQHSNDYGNTYAPIAKITSICMMLAYATREDLELFTFDIHTAFLNALLHEEIYSKQIPGFPLENPADSQ